MAKKKEGTLMEVFSPDQEAPTDPGVKLIALALIDDNPFQPRQSFPTSAIDAIAESIKQHGMLQIPTARPHPDDPMRVQLGFGHLRKKAFAKLEKKHGPKKFGFMTLNVKEISDKEMALWALEENIKRRDITTIEIARAVDTYMGFFEDATEKNLAEQLNMTQPNISNMRRVLRLPEQILAKIEDETINFTMGRELLALTNVTEMEQGYRKLSAHKVMLDAIGHLNVSGRQYGEPCTVPGIQRAIHRAAQERLGALEKEHASWRGEPLFDTRAADCLKCEDMVRTHPTKSTAAHFCGKVLCWEKKQQDHRDKMSTEAREQMQQDVVTRIVADEHERQRDQEEALVEVADAAAEGVEPATPEQQIEQDAAADISQEISAAEAALSEEDRAELETSVSKYLKAQDDQTDRMRRVNDLPHDYPCRRCANAPICERRTVHDTGNGKMVCENQQTPETAPEIDARAQVDIPEHMKELIAEKAGTRAQILDLKDIRLGNWGELQRGYNILTDVLRSVLDPDECTQRCTTGFHFAFDSGRDAGQVLYVCTNGKCLGKKKGAFTRARNAAGIGRKRAEASAIKQAIQETLEVLDVGRLLLVVEAMVEGRSNTRFGDDNGRIWWGNKVDVKVDHWTTNMPGQFWTVLEDLQPAVITRYIVEYSLWSLQYGGGSDGYKIQTTRALNRMGITPNVPDEFKEEEPAPEPAEDEDLICKPGECPECGAEIGDATTCPECGCGGIDRLCLNGDCLTDMGDASVCPECGWERPGKKDEGEDEEQSP